MKNYFILSLLFLFSPFIQAQQQRLNEGNTEYLGVKIFEKNSIKTNENFIIPQNVNMLPAPQKNIGAVIFTEPELMNNLKIEISNTIKNKIIQTQQIVPSADIVTLNNLGPQQNISRAFCKNSPDCSAAITKFGNTILANVETTSQQCKDMESTMASSVRLFESGNASWIGKQGGTSQGIINFFEKCTTSTLSSGINKLTGLIINLADKGTPGNGILINGTLRPILGMGVQIEKNRIYTARHVTYQRLADGSYRLLDIAKLAYLPYGTTAQVIPFTGESTGSKGEFDINDVANDQIQLQLANSFDPGVSFATIRKSTTGTLPAPANIIIPSFFIILAATKENNNGNSTLNPRNWSNYVVMDNRPSCKMITTNGKCILHSCNTIGGVSGSPIFLKEDGAGNTIPTVIAVHHGEASQKSAKQCSVDSGTFLNTGAIPNFNLN